MDGLLQPPSASPGHEQPTTNKRVAQRHEWARATGGSCGYAASLGQRKRVAHIPTAATEKREESGLKILSKRKRTETAGASTPLFFSSLLPPVGAPPTIS